MALRHFVVPSGALVASIFAGCQGLNLDPQPGPHVKLDTLRPTADFYERVDKPRLQSGTSLAGLSRENWAYSTFYVPVSGVEHKPLYTTDQPRRTDSTARQRGEFPSQATAAENSDLTSSEDQSVEALLAPVRAGWDIVWMVPKMFVTPPGRTVSSPRVAYERRPQAVGDENGGLKSAGLGVTLLELDPAQPPEPTTPAGEPAVGPVGPDGRPVPVEIAPPAPPPPQTPPGVVPTPSRGPGGAISGTDSPRRRPPTPPAPPPPPPAQNPPQPQPEPKP